MRKGRREGGREGKKKGCMKERSARVKFPVEVKSVLK